MKKYIPILAIFLLAIACNNPTSETEVTRTKIELPKGEPLLSTVDRNLLEHMYKSFDLRTIKSSFDPRVKGEKYVLADFFEEDQLAIEGNTMKIDTKDWFYSFTILERKDFDGNGIEDVKIQIEDKSKTGAYSRNDEYILTRREKGGSIVALELGKDG